MRCLNCISNCILSNYSVIQIKFVALVVLFFLEWTALIYACQRMSFSKYSHYVKTDDAFLRSFDLYASSSRSAKTDLFNWLDTNRTMRRHLLFSQATSDQSVCVSILSKKRLIMAPDEQRYYLTQTLMSMLTRVKLKHEQDLEIRLFNVESNPSDHVELVELSKLVLTDTVNLKSLPSSSYHDISLSVVYERAKLKELIDYTIILKRLYSIQHCAYHLTIEDDCIASFDWFDTIQNSLHELKSSNLNWFSIKYFTSFRTYDWMLHLRTDLNYMLYSLLLSSIQCYLFKRLILNRMLNASYIRLNRLNVNFNQIVCANVRMKFDTFAYVLITLNTLVLGLYYYCAHVQPLGTGLKQYSQGFNNVAMLYPRRVLLGLTKFFDNQMALFRDKHEFLPKDISVKQFIAENNFYEFIYEPSVFQHAGLHSSLGLRNLYDIKKYQYEPFQSYSFRDHGKAIQFNSTYFTE